MDVADAIGLGSRYGDASGTIDEQHVLDALARLSSDDPDNSDLFVAAAARVVHARSAGAEERSAGSFLTRSGDAGTTQLRYRSEMAEIFTDLAIDVGIRKASLLPAG